MLQNLQKFLDGLWPQKCLSCENLCGLNTFCQFCEASVRTLEQEAVFAFSGAIKKVIQQAKFGPSETKARRLISILPSPPSLRQGFGGQAIVFVPIHWRRRLIRGFDLSALFALTLGKQLKLPIWDLLQNTRFDKPLTMAKSKQERLQLTRGRYKLRKHVAPSRILLVDDVMTTGATLESARQVLESAGHQVTCFVLAKTPMALPTS